MGRINLEKIKKYLNKKTLIGVLCAGALMVAATGLSGGKSTGEAEIAPNAAERRIESILGEIQGIGRTSVMLYEGRDNGIFTDKSPQGAVVVADGADDPYIRQTISDTVYTLTGIAKHRIQVFSYKKE